MGEEINYEIEGIFPCPLYTAHRDLNLDVLELEDVKDIIEAGMHYNKYNSTSNDTYIFDTKLKRIKEFCEQHIKVYVEKVISPKGDLEFYITQSWLNITKHTESHHQHSHSNSIISGVFYISTVENDAICFHDPHIRIKERIHIPTETYHLFNSGERTLTVKALDLVLFPSWIDHRVDSNETIKDRISISFNVFARGILGDIKNLTELYYG